MEVTSSTGAKVYMLEISVALVLHPTMSVNVNDLYSWSWH
jgi:hypothetical protein